MRIKLLEKLIVSGLIITTVISGLTGCGSQETEVRAEIELPEAEIMEEAEKIETEIPETVKGLLKKETTYEEYSEEGTKRSETIEYQYDNEKRIIVKEETSSDVDDGSVTEYSYNEQGYVSEQKVYGYSLYQSGYRVPEYILRYEYDDQGKQMKEIKYLCESVDEEVIEKLRYDKSYDYDEQGRMIWSMASCYDELGEYSGSGPVNHWAYYEYDDLGGYVERPNSSSDLYALNIYDNEGRLIAEVDGWDGIDLTVDAFEEVDRNCFYVNSVCNYLYDEKGNLVDKYVNADPLGVIEHLDFKEITRAEYDNYAVAWRMEEPESRVHYSYLYDEKGNVLQKTWVETRMEENGSVQCGYGKTEYEYY